MGSPPLNVPASLRDGRDGRDGATSITAPPEPRTLTVTRAGEGATLWRSDAGVTCRRWNWRQGRRTQLSDDTTTAVFILDTLDPMTDAELTAAADDLVAHVRLLGPDVTVVRRLLPADQPAPHGL